MKIKPIRTKADLQHALSELERLWDAAPGSSDADTYEVLATLVDAYERAHVGIEPPNPVEAILFRLEQQGLTRKALEPIMGTRARVSEVLNGRRQLTLAMIRALNEKLGIPFESLLSETTKPRKKPARAAGPKKAGRAKRARSAA